MFFLEPLCVYYGFICHHQVFQFPWKCMFGKPVPLIFIFWSKNDLRIHPISDELSPISNTQSSDFILFSIISNHICITWEINSIRLMWYLPLNYSGIIHRHAWLDVLKSPRNFSCALTIIMLLGKLKMSRFMIITSEEIFKFFLWILRYCFILFGIYSAIIVFIK